MAKRPLHHSSCWLVSEICHISRSHGPGYGRLTPRSRVCLSTQPRHVAASMRESVRWRCLFLFSYRLALVPAGKSAAGPFRPRPPLLSLRSGKNFQVSSISPFFNSPDALACDFSARSDLTCSAPSPPTARLAAQNHSIASDRRPCGPPTSSIPKFTEGHQAVVIQQIRGQNNTRNGREEGLDKSTG